MFGGPWDSTLIMMGVPSLKMGVPSFYISVEFWKVVHPSMKGLWKGFEQALAAKHQVIFVSQPFVTTKPARYEFSIFFGGCFFFFKIWDLSDSEQQLEDGSWSVSAFLSPK